MEKDTEKEQKRARVKRDEMPEAVKKDARFATSGGTLHYAAPEILREEVAYSEACDIWSFGVVAFFLPIGSFPFDGKQEDHIPFKICNEPLDESKIRDLSDEAKTFIKRLLAKEAEFRPSAELLKNDPWLTATADTTSEPPSETSETTSSEPAEKQG